MTWSCSCCPMNVLCIGRNVNRFLEISAQLHSEHGDMSETLYSLSSFKGVNESLSIESPTIWNFEAESSFMKMTLEWWQAQLLIAYECRAWRMYDLEVCCTSFLSWKSFQQCSCDGLSWKQQWPHVMTSSTLDRAWTCKWSFDLMVWLKAPRIQNVLWKHC